MTKQSVDGRRRLTVFVPGNPGALVFVKHFVARLRAQQANPEDFLVWEHPHLHSAPRSMLPYAEFHARKIHEHIHGLGLKPDEVSIDVIGYSVGGYLSYLMAAHNLIPIARVFLVFPFLMAPRWQGELELRAIGTPRFYNDFLQLWRRAPKAATRWLIQRLDVGEHADWIHTTLQQEDARGYFVMAQSERTDIAMHSSCEYLFSVPIFRDPARFGCLLTTRDRWVPDAVLRVLAPFSHPLEAPTTHDFVLDPGASAAVARAVERMMIRG